MRIPTRQRDTEPGDGGERGDHGAVKGDRDGEGLDRDRDPGEVDTDPIRGNQADRALRRSRLVEEDEVGIAADPAVGCELEHHQIDGALAGAGHGDIQRLAGERHIGPSGKNGHPET